MLSLFSLLLAVYASNVSGKTDACGSSAEAITDFNLTEYLGIWHQITVNTRFYDVYERNYPLCTYANYSMFANGSVSVVNTGYNAAGEANGASGVATQDKPGVGAFEVSFYGSPPGPYHIIKMIDDSKGQYSVALVWSCDDFGIVQDLWILARDYSISEENYNAMFSYAEQSGIDVAKLKELNTTQTNCHIGYK